MVNKQVIEVFDILDRPDASADKIKELFVERGADNIQIHELSKNGRKTQSIKIKIKGKNGKSSGGSAPTLGILGRLGGDEFVALIRDPMTREDMERQMGRLKEEMNAIRLPKGAVTCSMGAIPVEGGAAIDDLYRKADRLLYEAKQKGKDQFVLSGEKDTC